MRNGRSGIWLQAAWLVTLAWAGCAESPQDDDAWIGTSAAAVDLPPPDAPLQHFKLRSPGQDFEQVIQARRAEHERRRLPGRLPPQRPGEHEHSFKQQQSPLPFEQQADLGADACFQRCGQDAACRLACLDGVADRGDGDADGDDDCLQCGRETGFLPRPDLWVDSIVEGKAVSLQWTQVDGAAHYVLYGLQWPYHPGDRQPVSMSWETDATTLRADLEPGFIYVFYVVALDQDEDIRSKPSRPITIRL
jgi:hypothetical protein